MARRTGTLGCNCLENDQSRPTNLFSSVLIFSFLGFARFIMLKSVVCLFLLLVLLLQTVIGTPDEDLIQAIYDDDAQALNQTIADGADINFVTAGNPAIAIAAREGKYGPLDALIASGADVHAVDSEGLSILSAAAKRGRPACAQLLLESGASITNKDFGWTAFHYACEARQKHTIQMFLESGCSPTDPTDNGLTPLTLVEGDIKLEALILSYIE